MSDSEIKPGLLVSLCYRLDRSAIYQKTKAFFYNFLENPRSGWRWWVDGTMIFLVLGSIFLFVLGIRYPLPDWADDFEHVAVSVFILEYLLRFWLASNMHKTIIDEYENAELVGYRFELSKALLKAFREKFSYILSPLGIIDLLAIVPSYRPLRILRFFLLFRLFKLFRYVNSVNTFISVLREKRIELGILALFISFIILSSSTAIYIFETQEAGGKIASYFDAIYWSIVTISTVGYGDITPVTNEGRVVALALIIAGIVVISFLTSIIVSGFTRKIDELHRIRALSLIHRRKDWIILFGYGRLGHAVVGHLKPQIKKRLLILDNREANVEIAREQGYIALQFDAKKANELKAIMEGSEIAIGLCLTGDDIANVFASLAIQRIAPNAKVFARVNDPAHTEIIRSSGVDYMFSSADVVAEIAAEYIGQPVAFAAIQGIISRESNFEIDTIMIHEGCGVDAHKLGDLSFSAFNLRCLGVVTAVNSSQNNRAINIKNNYFYFNPPDEFKLSCGDMLVVLGHEDNVTRFRDHLISGKGVLVS